MPIKRNRSRKIWIKTPEGMLQERTGVHIENSAMWDEKSAIHVIQEIEKINRHKVTKAYLSGNNLYLEMRQLTFIERLHNKRSKKK